MHEIECDICVIGAGSGGLSVAAGTSQLGLRTVLIEAKRMGKTLLPGDGMDEPSEEVAEAAE